MSGAELVLNPFAKIRAVYQGADLVGYKVRAPVRGVPLKSQFIARTADPAVCELLARLSTTTEDVDIDASGAPWGRLCDLGFFVPEPSIPDPVPYSLDVAAMSEVTDRSANEPTWSAREWIVAPSLVAQRSADLPAAIAPRVPFFPGAFRGQLPLAWVEDAATGALAPYHVRAEILDRLTPGGDVPLLDVDSLHALRAAGVLVPRDEGRPDVDAHRAELAAEGMTALRGFLPRLHIARMREYYTRRLAQGYVKLFARHEETRYIDHDEAIARFWLTQLTPIMGRLVGAAVKPSYVFFASYLDGSALRWHTDRLQCEYSVSLLVDYAPAVARADDAPSPWPLLVERRDASVAAVHQRLGDALVYKGRERPHARPPLAPGHTSTSLFLHYVDASFAGGLR